MGVVVIFCRLCHCVASVHQLCCHVFICLFVFVSQLLPTMIGSRVMLSIATCNTTIKDSKCWFDPTDLLRDFELQLNNPFERAVAIFVMNLITSHQTYIVAYSEWYDDVNKVKTPLSKFVDLLTTSGVCVIYVTTCRSDRACSC